MKRIPIRDLMSKDVTAVRSDAPLSELVALLAAHQVRSLPVIDAEDRLVGIVSESDLFLKERKVPFSMEKVPSLLGRIIDEHDLDQLDEAKRVPVEQIMCHEVETATEDTTLEEAAMRMMRLAISNLPVVRDDRIIGTVRRIDILGAIFGASPNDDD